jgi:hypothetical protein
MDDRPDDGEPRTIGPDGHVLPTKAECIKAAAVIVSEGYRILYTYPIEEAARRAVRPGGPTYDELLVRIAAKRRDNLRPLPSN